MENNAYVFISWKLDHKELDGMIQEHQAWICNAMCSITLLVIVFQGIGKILRKCIHQKYIKQTPNVHSLEEGPLCFSLTSSSHLDILVLARPSPVAQPSPDSSAFLGKRNHSSSEALYSAMV